MTRARESLVKRLTHAPPTDVAGGYLRPRWEDLCAEVLKLQVQRVTDDAPTARKEER